MTDIQVHYGVGQPLWHACRVARKGYRLGTPLALAAPAAILKELDVLLWTFDAQSFVPHMRLAPGQAMPPAWPVPVCLTEDPDQVPHHAVLVNVGEAVPRGFERFERLIDIVGVDTPSREAGRARWLHYRERGYEIQRVEVSG